jgi:c-di-GMP-binding flagellar brake protein YcgR
MEIERRKHPRIEAIELVSFENYETNQTELMQGMGKTLDISMGGMCLVSRHALPLGSTLKLTLALDENLFEAEGRIMSLTLTDDLNVKIHIQFNELAEKDTEALELFLAKLEEKSE